ncbi:MAG: hypothetical protein JWR19_3741, partial [Pedosphaera sp.]|nr:hypothetical protein [Pedosphaera sp.]
NGNELSDVQPSGKDLGANTLSFQLQRTAVNKAVWIPLLRNPMGEPLRPLLISVGVQGEAPLLVESSARNTYLWVIGWNWWTESWLAVLGVLFLLFILLAIYSDILKTPETDAEGRHLYSLSRTQAAFWLFITAFSFVFIWVVTCDVTTLNGSVLALIGISAGTYVAATILERRPSDSPTTAATVETKADPGNVVGKVVNEVQKLRLIDLFLKDILSDEKGISVPRFQIFAWTIILGIIFLVSVINELSMPEFNGTLLALMGISSATYVGAKMNQ